MCALVAGGGDLCVGVATCVCMRDGGTREGQGGQGRAQCNTHNMACPCERASPPLQSNCAPPTGGLWGGWLAVLERVTAKRLSKAVPVEE